MKHPDVFDTHKVSRMIGIGMRKEAILPHFVPLIQNIARNNVVYDQRNQSEDDLVQIALIKCGDIIDQFNPNQGNLFVYATQVIKRALWYEAKLRPLDHKRTPDEYEFDAIAQPSKANIHEIPQLELSDKTLKKLRTEPGAEEAAKYVFGVLSSNDFESNRTRVLKTVVQGFDVNPKHARFLLDHVLVTLRTEYSKGVKPVRDDKMFSNRFKHSMIPELRGLLGERAFERLIHFFGGLTFTVPSVDQIDAIDRDLEILKALSRDWTCGPTLSKKHNISPEGIKAVYKTCLHKLHTDHEYRELVSKRISLDQIPGYESAESQKIKKKPIPSFGERKTPPRRRLGNTDSMGFQLGCRNSLIYTLIVTGKCTRNDLVKQVKDRFGGTESAAKATVSAFLSDIKQPFGKFNTSRNLVVLTDIQQRLSFETKSLLQAQKVVMTKRQEMLMAEG